MGLWLPATLQMRRQPYSAAARPGAAERVTTLTSCASQNDRDEQRLKNRNGPVAFRLSGASVRLGETFWDAADADSEASRLAFALDADHVC